MMKKTYKYILFAILFVVVITPFFFVGVSTGTLSGYVEVGGWVGPVVYILLLVLSVVVAPFTMPLFFVSGGMFGPQLASVYNVIGWSIGAIVAFLIARYFNKGILANFGLFKKIKRYEQKIPQDMEFLSLVLLRMILPVDVLSYAIGLFSNISFTKYVLSTVIGVTPFAIIFAYGGNAFFDGKYIVVASLTALVLVAFSVGFRVLNKK